MKNKIIRLVTVLTLVTIGMLSGCVEEDESTSESERGIDIVNGVIVFQQFVDRGNRTILTFEGGSELGLEGKHKFEINREITIICRVTIDHLHYRYHLIEYEYEE